MVQGVKESFDVQRCDCIEPIWFLIKELLVHWTGTYVCEWGILRPRSYAYSAGEEQLLEIWLGGLDSNQDNQIQSLMYYQLYDLPAEAEDKSGSQKRPETSVNGVWGFVNSRL